MIEMVQTFSKATCHTSKVSQEWCQRNFLRTGEVAHFVAKEHWPPQSPDLNPLDYYFWNAVVTGMAKKKYTNLAEFTAEILRSIDNVPMRDIQNAIKAFPGRVRKVEEHFGGHCH